jgi:rhodanese-related sulfurtransferase
MARKQRSSVAGRSADRRGPARTPTREAAKPAPITALGNGRVRFGLIIVALVLATVVVIGADYAFGTIFGTGAGAAPSTSPTAAAIATPTQFGVSMQGVGGHWTNVTPAQLTAMLTHKDFTFVNVKTPYSGEIDGTDLYIPYDQLKARASELPGDKGAKILVYCLSGASSAVAAQTLLDLGYTNVWNLAGGMNAWTASGGQLVTKNR